MPQHRYDLDVWKLLFEVLREGAISRVAIRNGMDRAQLSRIIAGLEEEVGRPLLSRSGRRITPTQFALEALASLEPLLKQFEDRLGKLARNQDSLFGSIRLGCMPGFMQHEIVPMLVDFQKICPEVSFDVTEDHASAGYMKGDCDVMLYYGPVRKKWLVEHWVTRSLFVACASPEYLSERGFPKKPADLSSHSGILFTCDCREHPAILQLGRDEVSYRFKSEIRFNNILSAKAAAIAGAGIILDLPAHHCFADIVKGDLVPVLDGWHVPNLENYIGTTTEAAGLKRVRTFVDWYIERRRQIEGEQNQRLQKDYHVLIS